MTPSPKLIPAPEPSVAFASSVLGASSPGRSSDSTRRPVRPVRRRSCMSRDAAARAQLEATKDSVEVSTTQSWEIVGKTMEIPWKNYGELEILGESITVNK